MCVWEDRGGEGDWESHLVAGFNIELNLLTGECADSVEQDMVSAAVSPCSRIFVDDAIGGARTELGLT